jgi:hypothetical protein
LRGLVARCLEPDPAARLPRASAAIAILEALDAQPGVIVRACMAGPSRRSAIAVAATRFVGVGCADATVPTAVVGRVFAVVTGLPDRHPRSRPLPVRYPPLVARCAARGSVPPPPGPSLEPTWFPTLAYPGRRGGEPRARARPMQPARPCRDNI